MVYHNKLLNQFSQGNLSEFSERAKQYSAINMSEGVCKIPIEPEIISAIHEAIDAGFNSYGKCRGDDLLREKYAEKLSTFNNISCDPVSEILVMHGASGALSCTLQALFNPGDEIIYFEPFYPYHHKAIYMFGLVGNCQSLNMDDYSIDFDKLEKSISKKTKGILINNPSNPLGKVFSKEELLALGRLANKYDLYILSDEIYEFITFDGRPHVSIAALEDFAKRTITFSGFSKSFYVTGWRIGMLSGPSALVAKIALVQEILFYCPAVPFQHALIAALDLASTRSKKLIAHYQPLRDQLVASLTKLNFKVCIPQGAYYVLVDVVAKGYRDNNQAIEDVLVRGKVSTVQADGCLLSKNLQKRFLRFCYSIDELDFKQALINLQALL